MTGARLYVRLETPAVNVIGELRGRFRDERARATTISALAQAGFVVVDETEWCGDEHASGFLCDRPSGHDGRHRRGGLEW
jgi:hypothetical protein